MAGETRGVAELHAASPAACQLCCRLTRNTPAVLAPLLPAGAAKLGVKLEGWPLPTGTYPGKILISCLMICEFRHNSF